LLTIAVVLFFVLFKVEAKQQKDKHRESNFDVDRYEEVFTIVKNTYLIVLAPAVLKFLYSIVTDPAVPHILKALQNSCKREPTSYLGSSYTEFRKTN